MAYTDMTERSITLANPVQNIGSGRPTDTQVININVPTKPDAGLNASTYLTDPNTPPVSFGLTTTVIAGSGVKQVYFGDFIEMAEPLGLIGGANSQEFDYIGQLSPQQIKNALSSFGLIALAFNFDASIANILNNNLFRFHPKVDQDFTKKSLFTSQTRSNQQYDKFLLNVDQAFVWTNQTALRLNVTAPPIGAPDLVISLTFSFLDAVPYGQLASYLAETMLPIQVSTLAGK